MKWKRAPLWFRLFCLLAGGGSVYIAWFLTVLSSSGAEDVPPPFILAAMAAGLTSFCIAVAGRYPWFE